MQFPRERVDHLERPVAKLPPTTQNFSPTFTPPYSAPTRDPFSADAASSNCAVSVDPAIATVVDLPAEIAIATASK
jgi:hypothetical protein